MANLFKILFAGNNSGLQSLESNVESPGQSPGNSGLCPYVKIEATNLSCGHPTAGDYMEACKHCIVDEEACMDPKSAYTKR